MCLIYCHNLKEADLSKEVNVNIEEMVMTCLCIIGIGASYRTRQSRFQQSGETISRRFNEVLSAFHSLAPQYVHIFSRAQNIRVHQM